MCVCVCVWVCVCVSKSYPSHSIPDLGGCNRSVSDSCSYFLWSNLHHLHEDWFPIIFNMPPGTMISLNFSKRKCFCHCATKARGGMVFPWSLATADLGTNGITIKKKLLMEEAKMETKGTQKWAGDIHLMESSRVMSGSVPPLMCVSSHHQDLRNFKNQHLFYRISYQQNLPASSYSRLFCFWLFTELRSEILDQTGSTRRAKALLLWSYSSKGPPKWSGFILWRLWISSARLTVATQVISSLIPLSPLLSSACGVTRQTKKLFQISECWTSSELGSFFFFDIKRLRLWKRLVSVSDKRFGVFFFFAVVFHRKLLEDSCLCRASPRPPASTQPRLP